LKKRIVNSQNMLNLVSTKVGEGHGLFAEGKRQRILAAADRWPQLPASSIAVVASASPSYVSDVLKSRDYRGFV
jgi:hypothetical protein